ncbi:MAG: DUF6443 domain-containing protein [Flavobacterium sp.]|uniref:DUF6443 domain-containing protein n=1 Tax=Flavobacterium sp. TaxID=239 RepID=UPI0025B84716|nr:DUF6443 domain-containing protein [Flavobacterium sp.]MCK6606875.1 DUF6443 domain-containing protein [Flavobacterium sp.]
MKKLLFIISILPVLALGQSTDQNYVKTITYKKQTTQGSVDVSEPSNAVIQVSYFDGLGRPIQQIAHKQSNTGKDIVTHIEYDQFGRQTRDYLPYVSTGASLNYLPSAQTDLLSFYASPNPTNSGNPYFEATENPFSEKQLENSPLNRVLKQAAPGDAWGLPQTTGLSDDRSIKFDYQTNVANEVKYFKVVASWDSNKGLYEPAIVQTGFYTENQLYKTITKDENWTSGKNNTTEEFKDKEGKVVLKRAYNNIVIDDILVESQAKHDTYYVYDQYGNLTYVIPPLAEGDASQTKLDNLGYQYKYDSRNRLVEKKLPEKQWEFIVYDKLDRPIATGPAYNPYGDGTLGWMITQYDVFGRVTQTGWKLMTVTEAERKNNQNTINYGSNPFTLAQDDILIKNFYDNYSFAGAPNMPQTIEGQTAITNVKGLQTGSWVRVLDEVGSTTAETSYTLYDFKYRPIRTRTTNFLGGYTEVDTKLDWVGKVEKSVTKHKYNTSASVLTTTETFTYSPQDKLLLHKHKINTGSEELIAKNNYDELGQLIKKEVGGQDFTGANSYQKIDYKYNIRGWLKEINNVDDITSDNDLFAFKINYNEGVTNGLYNGNISETFWKSGSDNILRKYEYSYDKLNRLLEANYSRPDFSTAPVIDSYLERLNYDKNGNITSLVRNGDLDANDFAIEIDNLVYTYDDDNKNLLKKVLDESNHPQGFKDDSNGITDADDDYEYDDFGNLIKDANKEIGSISYNHLNLPMQITFVNGTSIQYLYNAVGQKVRKIVSQLDVTTTDYMGGFQYVAGKLSFFPHSEGYITATPKKSAVGAPISYSFNYVYQYKDHLGNNRLSFANNILSPGSMKILEENHYYPFGLKHTNYNTDQYEFVEVENGNDYYVNISQLPAGGVSSYKYKYNGQEWQDELGLNVTAMDYRQYDGAIGRFNGMDKLAEMSHNLTPYRFGFNNPVFWSDPSGLFETRKEARAYRREHSISGSIKKGKDGNFFINDTKKGYIYEKGDDSDTNDIDTNPNDGVVVASGISEVTSNQDTEQYMSTGMWTANTAVGFASLGIAYKGQYHLNNELWRFQPNGRQKFITPWSKMKNGQSYWNNTIAKNARLNQINKVQGARNIASKLTKVGGVLLVGDIALSGDIKPSHVINGAMLAASTTGFGTIVSGAWFIADFGTMGVNYLINGEAKGLGDMIDESSLGKSVTVKMYDGAY